MSSWQIFKLRCMINTVTALSALIPHTYISLQIQASHNCCSWWVLKWYNTCIPLPFFPSLHLPHYHPFLLPLSPLSLNVFLWMYNHVYACIWMLHVHTHTHTLRIHIWLWRTWLTVAGKSHDIPIQVTWHVTWHTNTSHMTCHMHANESVMTSDMTRSINIHYTTQDNNIVLLKSFAPSGLVLYQPIRTC